MNTKYAVINDSRQAQVVKYLRAVSPNGDRTILAQTFVIKPIHLSDLTALMIAADKGDPIRVSNLSIKLFC